jgi:DNA-binding transcriptional LysR family regulator
MVDIRRIDLGLLHALVVLLDESNVSRAAARLNLTQSTVSGMLNRLRILFDDPLLVRKQRGMIRTARAQDLRPKVESLLADANLLLQPVNFNPAVATQTFNIAASDYVQAALLAPLMARLSIEAPSIRVAAMPTGRTQVADGLHSGSMDMVLSIPDFLLPSIRTRRLYDERYVCVVRRDHPWEGTSIDIDAFCELGHVIVSPNVGGFSGATDECLSALGRHRRVVYSTPNFAAVPPVLLATNLIAVLPYRLVATMTANLRALFLPLKIPGFSVHAAWHERVQSDPAHVWLRRLICETAEQSQDLR